MTKKGISYYRVFLAGTFILVSSFCFSQELKTTFYNDYSRWKLNGESFNTVFINSYDQWKYNSIDVRQWFRGDNNTWNIGTRVELRTRFQNSFDKWEINGNGYQIQVETIFHGDNSRWRISGDIEGEMRTTFMNDFERWTLDFEVENLPDDITSAIAFIAIFTSVHYKN